MGDLSDVDRGFLAGLLVGGGSFGGDGKNPQITLRMHTRQEPIFRWLMERFPRSKLYGPYDHGGRSYYQWMARGQALVEDVLPVLEEVLPDGPAAERLAEMRTNYAGAIARAERRAEVRREVEGG